MRRNAHRASFDVRIQRMSQVRSVFLRKTAWCEISEAEKGKKDIQASGTVYCGQLESRRLRKVFMEKDSHT